jgi:hypothetical protein
MREAHDHRLDLRPASPLHDFARSELKRRDDLLKWLTN